MKWPCYYGIDFATRAELIAAGLDVDAVCRSIGADSLGYVSQAGLIAATGVAEQRLCTACFDGKYPIGTPFELRNVQQRLDQAAGDAADDLPQALRLP